MAELNDDILLKIKSGLNDCVQIIHSPLMTELKNVMRDSVAKLDEPMQLAIIGKISSSKSTLVNAILGKDELMTTGHKEVTYNVGWLKHGKPDEKITIHYKNERTPAKMSRNAFEQLSVDIKHKDIDNISYIELFDDAEILKEINIIDTPGLDSKKEKDSQNTLDFISKVRPDAVVMLFTHSIAESVLDIVSQFNAGGSFNPLNAIGVLSKIDLLWEESLPRDKSAHNIGARIVANKKKREPAIEKTLFNLYPVSSLLFLASSTITDNDIELIKKSYTADTGALKK